MLLLRFTTFSSSHGFLPLAKHKNSSPLLFAILITHIPLKSSQFPKQAMLFGVSVCFHMLFPMPRVYSLFCPVKSSLFLELSSTVTSSLKSSLIFQGREATPPPCTHRSLCTYICFLWPPYQISPN